MKNKLISRIRPWLFTAPAALLAAALAHAESENLYCHGASLSAGWAVENAPSGRRYAPSREVDILHLALEIVPDWDEEKIAGTATLRFKPISRPLAELKLDAVDLHVDGVDCTAPLAGHQVTDRQLVVTFGKPLLPDQETTLTIRYHARPERGLYFRTPTGGYRADDMHFWTQGEPTEARHWFPCYDAPNEKFTSEVTCRVRKGMTALSNGKLISQSEDPSSGLVTFRWLQDQPHTTYLICLVAGYLKSVEDRYKDIPLALYTPASEVEHAPSTFKETKEIMAFFEEEIGVPYPWAKYFQVCVSDYHWGGMENTSLTVLTDRTLFTDEFEQLRSSQGLVAHEMAHQWFGDFVTCKDWSDLWLNEGFATYYEALFENHKNGRDAFLYEMYQNAKEVLTNPNQTNAIVRRDYRTAEDQFGYQAYPKGSWILHMLRQQLGTDLFRQCIKTYLERHRFGNVETEDLIKVVEELSGRSFDQFFDQYVYHASQPILAIAYSWDQESRMAKLSVTQEQKVSDDVLLFHVPLTVRFKSKTNAIERELMVGEKSEDFYFPLPEAPEIVRIDPALTLLARINFSPSSALLKAQLADGSDMMGRLLACEQFGQKKDTDAVNRLKDVLNGDSFYGVRLAASSALRAINNDAAYQALCASMKQTDARVRQRVITDITSFYRESSGEIAALVLADEKNPDIQVTALRALGAYAQMPGTREKLLAALDSRSFRHVVAEGAVATLRSLGDPSYVPPLLQSLQRDEAKFSTAGFGHGLEAVAYLARNEEKKDAVREFVVPYVKSPKERLQIAAINALGRLGDPQALPVLETFTKQTKESPERVAAERAMVDLRADRKPGAELGTLRGEVLNLQKENRQLRKDLDELTKKIEALSGKATPEKPGKKSSSKSSKN